MNNSIIPMDQRIGKIFVNGEMIEWQEAKTHLLTHSLHYGTGAFEGIRSYNGKIFKSEQHFDRLRFSAQHLGIEIPYSNKELTNINYQLLNINNIKDSYIRPLIYKGAESTRLNGKCSDNIMIAAWELKNYFDEAKFNKGIKVTFSKYFKLSEKYAPVGTKISGLYVLNLLAKSGIPSDCDDAIILDENRNIAECTTSNIFMVKNGILKTPTPTCFLNGITRQTIIELANKNKISFEEKTMSVDELLDADEIFIVGTAIEIMPISQIDDKSFAIGDITKKIHKLFIELMNNL
jgi:branched-chain amino acid aminotransferase group I